MADGYADRFQVIQNAYDKNGNVIPSRWDVKPNEKPDPKQPNYYQFVPDPELQAEDSLVVLNTNVFKAVFGKGEEGKITKTGEAVLIVHYPAKAFGFINYEAKRRIGVGVARKNADKKYPDAPREDLSWLAQIGLSQKLWDDLNESKYVKGQRIKLAISTKKPNPLLGAIWQHPRQDINMGFIWAEVGLLVSVVFYILDLFGDAYHWSNHFRAFFDHLGK